LEADRLRARLNATTDQLRDNLRPTRVKEEVIRAAGLDGLSATSVLHDAASRYPVPSALVGIAVAALAVGAVRRGLRKRDSGVGGSVRDAISSISNSATEAFRERAEKKRQEFVGMARSQIQAGVSGLADMIETKVEGVIDVVPEASGARPLLASALKVLLLAAVEGVLAKA
jgi:hypothetical protein